MIRKALDRHFPAKKNVEVIAEPGRFFVSSAFTLCTNVIAKRASPTKSSESNVNQYYINDGVYGALNCVLFENRKLVPYSLEVSFGNSDFENLFGT